MKELIESVDKLATEELERANKKFPLFSSAHEGYAITKEELEEASSEIREASCFLEDLWYDIKHNDIDEALKEAENIKSKAILLAAEAIQVAAMAQKFQDSLKK